MWFMLNSHFVCNMFCHIVLQCCYKKSLLTLHISTLSFKAAICKGVRPSLFLAFTWLGLIFNSHVISSLRPEAAASCKGKSPLQTLATWHFLCRWNSFYLAFLIHKLAPRAPISLTVSNWPLAHPQWAGLRPLRSCRFASAPCASNSAVASAWPTRFYHMCQIKALWSATYLK